MPTSQKADLSGAVARLEARWGSASIRLGMAGGSSLAGGSSPGGPGISGSLALAPEPVLVPSRAPIPAPADELLSTGFARLDALLGVAGLPRGASASFRGSHSSGKTALALHCLAQAQAQGAIAGFLDLSRIFDPHEAVSRGVDLRWLLVLRPADAEEGFAMAAALLSGRQVDLLVVDLPPRLAGHHEDAMRRIAAHTRRQGSRLIVLEPAALGRPLHGALAESVALRLEFEQRAWLRAGRDVVGRCVTVTVAKNRFGPPGRAAELEIRYPTEGEHSPALDRFAACSN